MNHGYASSRKQPGFTMEVQTNEMDGFSQQDRVIQHSVKDLQRAVEEGTFQVETPRVITTQDDIEAFSLGWSRDTRFGGQYETRLGPLQLDLDFDAEVEDQILYGDLEKDMFVRRPQVVLYGDLHIWNVETPHHDLTLNYSIGDDHGLALTARLSWLTVEPAGWR